MKAMQHRFARLALGLLVSIAFAACQGLDDRTITRGPADGAGDQATGGDDGSSGSSAGSAGSGNQPGLGGSENFGGQVGNPFGGETFAGGAPPTLDGPPEVLKVNPASGAEDVEPNGRVSLLFSEGLDEASLDSASFSIRDGATDVAGDISYGGVVATFAPAERLALLATYDVSATQAITDSAGQPLKEAFSSQFTVRDGAWAPQRPLFDDQSLVYREHASGSDARGNMLAVYGRTTDPQGYDTTSPFARWISLATGPGDEQRLDDSTQAARNLQVAVSPEGDAIAAWRIQDAAGTITLRARRFVNGAWEAAAQNVAQMSARAAMEDVELSVAIGGGQVLVSWIRGYTNGSWEYAVEYTAAALDGEWPPYPESPWVVSSVSPNNAKLTQVRSALDAKGNALVSFAHGTAATSKGIYYARKAVGGSWQLPAKIPGSTFPNDGHFLISDGDGAMAVWSDYDTASTKYGLLASRYTKARQFVAPVAIHDPSLSESIALRSDKALATNGASYFVTWTQAIGQSRNTYVQRFDVSSGAWDALPTPVNDGVASAIDASSVGVDAHGNAIVCFEQQGEKNTNVMAARFVARTGRWSEAERLTGDAPNFENPQVSVAQNGAASVLFMAAAGKTRTGHYRLFR